MTSRCQTLATRLQKQDSVLSAESVKHGSNWYVDVQLAENKTTNDIVSLLGEGFAFRESPNEIDARIIDEKQQSTGVITTR